ncbi:MAG TPA: hypothetical protein VFU14_15210 [Acidimicrobiales bacterium]|nr:hypothetical protein [Acidimicrobiales bacterium]
MTLLRRPRPVRLGLALALSAGLLGSCGVSSDESVPWCEPDGRLAIMAQSVPTAAYVPCVAELPTGWSFDELAVDDDGARFTLESDRADRAVQVQLTSRCDVGEATPISPSDEGVRTYHFVTSIQPRYAGRLLDVFPGGCVVTRYDFERGPHVALVTELQAAIGLFTRLELRHALEADLGVRLDP